MVTTHTNSSRLSVVLGFLLSCAWLCPAQAAQQIVIIGPETPSESYRPLADKKSYTIAQALSLTPFTTLSDVQRRAAFAHHVEVGAGPGSEIPVLSAQSPKSLPDQPEENLPPPPSEQLLVATIQFTEAPPPSYEELGWSSWVSLLSPALKNVFRTLTQPGAWLIKAARAAGLELEDFIETQWRRIYKTVMQKGGPLAWVMEKTLGLSPAYVYVASDGHRIPVYDAYAPGDARLKAEDFNALRQFLDAMPPGHLDNIPALVNLPCGLLYPGAEGFADFSRGIGLNSPRSIVTGALAHEVGHFVQQALDADARNEWSALHESQDVTQLDYIGGPYYWFPFDVPGFVPYGATNELEDFATIYHAWTNDSASPPIGDTQQQSTTLWEEAFRRAATGHSKLLEKTLYMAGVFTDPNKGELTLYSRHGLDPRGPTDAFQSRVQHQGNQLQVGDVAFTLNDELKIIAADIPGTRYWMMQSESLQGQALRIEFSNPVDIPSFTRRQWGLRS
jgi:hypothetical protein